jgi:hypothetical protein
MSCWKVSYDPNKKANKAIIKACVKEAIEWKAEIKRVLANQKKHCQYYLDCANRDKDRSIHKLAMESLGYKRLRAWLGIRNDGDYPHDRPAFEWWRDKTNINYLKG